jgi:CBS domain-containing protein
MKVKDLMTRDPATCTPDTTVAEAAHLMWEQDCGILPVVDDGALVGVVTDRDMYIALATRNERAAGLRVGAVASQNVATCVPEDDVREALITMKRQRVRRLPVVGFGTTVVGILSINDILHGARDAVPAQEIVDTLQTICGRHETAGHVVAA